MKHGHPSIDWSSIPYTTIQIHPKSQSHLQKHGENQGGEKPLKPNSAALDPRSVNQTQDLYLYPAPRTRPPALRPGMKHYGEAASKRRKGGWVLGMKCCLFGCLVSLVVCLVVLGMRCSQCCLFGPLVVCLVVFRDEMVKWVKSEWVPFP